MSSIAERYSQLSNASCREYEVLVAQLRERQGGLAARLTVGASHTQEVFGLEAAEVARRRHFTELVWEGVLEGTDKGAFPPDKVADVLSWLAVLRAYERR